ncbi:MAG TPA: protoporphyrinogen oxidase [Chlamydiales bacterium]|nr:protoporphyrinogen oxidase [Chlamydiales bacterium]
MKTALILGGGISGLSAAWFLSRRGVRVTLLEKEDRLGGLIQTDSERGMLFERGPRTFSEARSPALLQLIRDLGLENELLFSKGGKRYLWHQGRLCSLGSFLPLLLFSLLKFPPKAAHEETIYEFACRRFNAKVAETLFDPLTLGIYAGDIRKLSVQACFPRRRLFPQKSRLFTLRGGMRRLIEELEKKLPTEIIRNCEVEALQNHEVIAGGKTWRADQIYCALPAPAVNRLLGAEIPSQSISAVQIGFQEKDLSKKGYGYLVPTQEKELLLGMVWDSSIFPEQCPGTRFTAMVRGEKPIPIALEALHRHLGIKKIPIYISSTTGSIPQFEVGHAQRIAQLEAKAHLKGLILLGNYLSGVSVEDCIQRTIKILITN